MGDQGWVCFCTGKGEGGGEVRSAMTKAMSKTMTKTKGGLCILYMPERRGKE